MFNFKKFLCVTLCMAMVVTSSLHSFSMNDNKNGETNKNVEESIDKKDESLENEESDISKSEVLEDNISTKSDVEDVVVDEEEEIESESESEDDNGEISDLETESETVVENKKPESKIVDQELNKAVNMSDESYLVYYLNGGYFIDNRQHKIEVEKGTTIVLPTKNDVTNLDHFTFDGWYLDSDFEGEAVESVTIDKEGETNVYAKWLHDASIHVLPSDWWHKGFPDVDADAWKIDAEAIEFVENDIIPNDKLKIWNIDETGLKCYDIYKNIEGYGTRHTYVISIPKGDKLIAPVDSSYLFAGFKKLVAFVGIDLLDTREVKDMEGMFEYLGSIENLDLSSFNTSSLESMRYIFSGGTNLKNIDISTWDTSRVTNMQGVYSYCPSLEVIDVSNFDTSRVKHMGQLFCVGQASLGLDGEYHYEYGKLKEIIYGDKWTTANVENMSMMFGGTPFKTIDVTNLDTSNVTDMSYMFDKCIDLEYLDLSSFDTSKVESMQGMFRACHSLTGVDFSSFDTSNVYTMESMFEQCYSFKQLDLSMFKADNISTMEKMFNMKPAERTNSNPYKHVVHNGKPSLEVIDISGMKFTGSVDMTGTFYNNDKLTTIYCDKDIYAASGAYATRNFSKGKLDTFYGCVNLVGGEGRTYDGSIYNNNNGGYNEPIDRLATPSGYFTVGKLDKVDQINISFVNTITNIKDNIKINKGEKLSERSDAMKGYTFLYWYTDDETVPFDFDIMLNDDTTLYSKWQENSYTITYNLNGGEFKSEDNVIKTRLFTNEVILPTADDLKRTDYIFKSWYLNKELNGTPVTKISANTDKNVEVYAKWELDLDTSEEVTITYKSDKGVVPDPLTIKKGKLATNYDLGEVEGYTFSCWVKFGTNIIFNFEEPVMEDIMLEAAWNMKSYDIYFMLNGGDGTEYIPAWTARMYNEAYDLPRSSIMVKPGFTFGGWYEDEKFSNQAITKIPAYTSRSITVYAKWNPVKNQIHILEKDWFSDSKISNFRDSITSIEFLVSDKEPEYFNKSQIDNKGLTCYIVKDYLDKNKNDFDYKAVVRINPDCQLKTSDDASYLFDGFKNVKRIDNLKILDTSDAENMEYMFKDCESLETIDLSKFDTRNVESMNSMFVNCYKLQSIDLSSFNTEKVTDISYMFFACESATEINVSSFNTLNVEKMHSLFRNCKSVKTIDVSSFNTSKIYDMSYIFAVGGDCYDENYDYVEKTSDLENIIFGKGFDTSKAQTMFHMFAGASVKSLDLSGFDTQNVRTMGSMFDGCVYLETLDLSNFNVEKVEDFRGTFMSCHRLKEIDLSNFNTKSASDMTAMFANCFELVELDLSAFDTSKLVYADRMFANHGENIFVYNGNHNVKNNNPHSSLKVINLSSFKLTGERIWVDEMFDLNYNLETIYATTDFVTGNILYAGPYHTMFGGCTKLVGGNGTKFSAQNKGESFACIDTDDTPGYFTDIADKDKIKTYNIEYKLNNGVFVPTYQAVTVANVGEDVVLPTAKDMKWTKNGDFRFGGWYDNDQFSGDSITILNHSEDTDITLYAKWDEYYKLLVAPVEAMNYNLYYNYASYYITAIKNTNIEIPKNKAKYFSFFADTRYTEMTFHNYYVLDKNNKIIKTVNAGDKYLLTTNDYKLVGTWLGTSSRYTYSTIVSKYGKPDYDGSKLKSTGKYSSSGSSGGSGGGGGGGGSVSLNINQNYNFQNVQQALNNQQVNQAPNAAMTQDKAVQAVSRSVEAVVTSANSNWVKQADGTWSLVVESATGQITANNGFVNMVDMNAATGKTTNSIYYFDSQGKMATGWVKDNTGSMYFFETANTADVGKMTTGWKEIQGGYYYFGNDGKMMTNGTTPDGYKVGADGSWQIK